MYKLMARVKTNTPVTSEQRVKIVSLAKEWIGTPYHHQQSVKGVGCDCLGLVRGVYEAFYHLPPDPIIPYSRDWADVSGQETLLSAASDHLIKSCVGTKDIGDVLIFRFRNWMVAKHVGILVSSSTMVHAIEGSAVCEVHLGAWWQRHIAGVFSFPSAITPQN